MARMRRFELADVPQHVIQRGNNRQDTFFGAGDYRLYLDCLSEGSRHFGCDIHAYVLMTNHVHLLVTPRQPMAIAKLMQSVGRRYVRCINRARDRTGTLWEGRYRASLIESEEYLLTCYRYIEENPIRAGMVSDPGSYPWSSHRHNAWGCVDPLLVEHGSYLELAETGTRRRACYRQMFETAMDPIKLAEVRTQTHQGGLLGSDAFRARFEEILKRPLSARRQGRPSLGLADTRPAQGQKNLL